MTSPKDYSVGNLLRSVIKPGPSEAKPLTLSRFECWRNIARCCVSGGIPPRSAIHVEHKSGIPEWNVQEPRPDYELGEFNCAIEDDLLTVLESQVAVSCLQKTMDTLGNGVRRSNRSEGGQ